jgi:hypothetical protein
VASATDVVFGKTLLESAPLDNGTGWMAKVMNTGGRRWSSPHHGTDRLVPSSPWVKNPPVGPSAPSRPSSTGSQAPCSTVSAPRFWFRSVAT